jgi:ethanolaminephosphotransferase
MVPKIGQEDNDNDDSEVSSKHTGEYYYLTEDARNKLKTYSYRGGDNSLLYQYILSPLAAWLVNTILPRSMAPNTVTSIGLVWMITAYVAYWWYAPSLEFTTTDADDDESFVPPRWIFLWNGISILVYQTLDNMDGKQARRTGSSSPLGLLFDHGCDAINSIFGSVNVIIGMNLSPSENMFQTWLLVFGPFAMFYFATWEQYFTGELILPIVNGPTEGLVGTALLSFVSFSFGPEYWQQTTIFDSLSSSIAAVNATAMAEETKLRNCDLLAIAISIGISQEIILKSIAVTRKYKGSAAGLVPMLVLALCYLIIGHIDPNVWLDIPRTSLHLSMVLFVEMSTELMLAHVTAQSFFPWRWQLAPLIGITVWVAVFGNGEGLKRAIVVYTWTLGTYLLMKCRGIIREICDTLEIWCFDILTPHYQVRKETKTS